jgi:xylose isomerase
MRGTGADPFGGGVYDRPWDKGADAVKVAQKTQDALFEFCEKLGVDWYCFHDRDMAPEGPTIKRANAILSKLVKRAKKLQKQTGVRLLWGTANLFSHPRYTHGAATNPDPGVFAYAAGQVRRAIDATVELGGLGYVFWGGREGYSTLLNTDLKQEREQMAAFLRMAVEYGRKAGFKGVFLIEPKPKEPSTHQYDADAATTLGFLREFGLIDDFMLNVEANHSTLAGHTWEHELASASIAGKLGSLDINRGDPNLGWDTDQFPTDLYSATMAMLVILRQGGLPDGGLNFDAKVRRGSFDALDLFHAHIGGMDTFARALLVADRMIADGALSGPLAARYSGWTRPVGRRILSGEMTLEQMEDLAVKSSPPRLASGAQEALENIVNDYLYGMHL